ncbi:hypothetical protein C0995_005547 [Termitomyces sp. Mi166|nr:hypothetical protein C0995_005547 [Termitomyces sp. Mi166\
MYLPSLAVLFLFAADVSPVAAKAHALNRLPRHHDLSERLPRTVLDATPNNSTKIRRRRSCKAKSSATTSETMNKGTPAAKSTTKGTPAAKSTTKGTPTTKSAPTPTKGSGHILGVAFKPDNWPTETQAGAAPAATRTSAADPFLMELSKSYNNKNNHLYTQVHTGDMTFYSTGTVACGDTYEDSSFTAAVSKIMYDAWPGATAETNRNPICGPYVPGRKTISPGGNFVTSIQGQSFVNVGGDGFLNCDPKSQCHVPLTATVRHGDKEIIVSIVDRCEGCKEGDIDLTMTAFKALADPALGRTGVTWWFNQY